MSNTGNRRFKEEMINKKRIKLSEIIREEENLERKIEGKKFNNKK
ncbi:hypothetical protein [Clostridium thermobutyricum]|nr:hypothetical protein [Clostridium thermobutyricum]